MPYNDSSHPQPHIHAPRPINPNHVAAGLALNSFFSPSDDEEVDHERERGHDSWRSYFYPKPLSPSGFVSSARSDVKPGLVHRRESLRDYGPKATSEYHYSTPTFIEPHFPLEKYSHSHHSASSSISSSLSIPSWRSSHSSNSSISSSSSSYEPSVPRSVSPSSSITNEGPDEMGVPIHKDRIHTQTSFGLLDPIGPPRRQTGMGRYHDSMNHPQPHERMPSVENDEKIVNPSLYSLRSSAVGYNRPSHLTRPTVRYQSITAFRSPWIEPFSSNDLWRYDPPRPSNHDGSSSYSLGPPVPPPNRLTKPKSKSTFRKHPFPLGGPNPFRPGPPPSTLNSPLPLPHPHPHDSSHPSFVPRRLVFDPFRDEDESHRLTKGVPMRNPAVIRGIKRLLADDEDDYNDYVDDEKEEKEWDTILYPTSSSPHICDPDPEEESESESEEADWHRRHRGTAEMTMKWVEGKTLWDIQKRKEEEMEERINREREGKRQRERKRSSVVNERAHEIFMRERRRISRESSPDPQDEKDDDFDDFPICEMSIAMGLHESRSLRVSGL